MPISQALLGSLAPHSAIDYGNQSAQQAMQQAQQAAQIQQSQIAAQVARKQMDAAQEEMLGRKRDNVAKMYAALGNLPLEKQQEGHRLLKPLWEQYLPEVRFGDEYDPSYAKYAQDFLIGPKDILSQQVEMQKAQMQREMMTPYQQAQVEALNERNAIMRDKMSALTSGKALTAPAMKDLEKKAAGYEELTRLSSGFKPEYAGNTVTGGLETFAGRLGGENLGLTDPGQTQWWQDYQGYVNQVRNDLFGAALTATEKAEFEKSIVTPRMDPKQAAANLSRQQAIVQKGLVRAGKVYAKGGFNADQINEYVPQGLPDVDTSSPTLDAMSAPATGLESLSDQQLLQLLGAM